MSKKLIEYILLSLILLSGFLVRLYKIDNPVADWHSWRQADTASVAKIYVQQGINLLYPRYHDISSAQSGIFNPGGYRYVEFPIYNAINAVLAKSFPILPLEVWARLITISFAIITGYFLYLIGKRYLGEAGGLLSVFFYLFIPYNIYFTRVILPDPFGAMCTVVALFIYITFIDTGRVYNLYLSGAAMAMSLLIKPFYAFYLLPLVYLTVKKYGLKKVLKNRELMTKFLIYTIVIFLPLLLWRVWEGRHPEGIPLFTWAFNSDGIRFRPAFWRWIFQERLGELILGGWGLVLFIFGVLRPKEENLFIKYSILGMLVYVVVVATANVRHDYYQIVAIPAIALVLASGVVYLWQNTTFNKIATRALVLFCIPMMFMTGWLLIRYDFNIIHPEIIDAGHAIDRIVPKDALVVAPYSGDTAFLYQTNRSGWPVIDDSIDNIIKKGASYYVSVDLESADTKMLEGRFKTVEKTDKYIIINLLEPLKTK